MKENKILLLSFTSNAINENKDFPIQFSIDAINEELHYSSLISPVPEWKEWEVKYQQFHGISRANALKNGLSVNQTISRINEICIESNVKTLYSPNYDFDIILLNHLEEKSFIKPIFKMADFYKGINPYQRKLWNHFYFSILSSNFIYIHTAPERNKASKESFEKILKIHSINKEVV